MTVGALGLGLVVRLERAARLLRDHRRPPPTPGAFRPPGRRSAAGGPGVGLAPVAGQRAAVPGRCRQIGRGSRPRMGGRDRVGSWSVAPPPAGSGGTAVRSHTARRRCRRLRWPGRQDRWRVRTVTVRAVVRRPVARWATGRATTGAALTTALRSDAASYRWVAATFGSQSAATLELASDEPVMAIGGFNGEGGNISLATFEAYVGKGEIHYFISSGSGGGGAPGGGWRRKRRRGHHQLGRGPLHHGDDRRPNASTTSRRPK